VKFIIKQEIHLRNIYSIFNMLVNIIINTFWNTIMFLLRTWGEPWDRWQDLDDLDRPWYDDPKGWSTRKDSSTKDSLTLKLIRELRPF